MSEEKTISITEKLIVRLFTSWCFTAVCMSMSLEGLIYSLDSVKFIDTMDFIAGIVIMFLIFTLLEFVIKLKFKRDVYPDYIFFIVTVVAFGINAVFNVKDVYLAVALILGVCMCIYYVEKKLGHIYMNSDIKFRTVILVTVLLGIFTFGIMSILTIIRYKTFHTSTFDFGIFTQMFYYMKNTGLPLTTCERSELMSHFSVHVSPIYYLILPVYMIFPFNETLIIFQLLFIVSGIVPLMLVCKNRKLSNFVTMSIAVVYLLSPVLFGGLFYDFHENKFLTTLILWLLYFMEKNNKIGMYILAVLVLMVKEDAGIYVACIGLYMLATKERKYKKHGGILFIISVIWFLLAYFWLDNGGDGAMVGRYKNFIGTEGSVFDILETIIKNPAYFFKQILSAEKLENILWVLVPVMFMPFRVKSIKELILLIPFLVINLMPSYVYQYDIAHQYYYGSFTLMLYLLLINIGELLEIKRLKIATFMMVASVIMFTSVISVKSTYITEYKDYKVRNELIEEVLRSIPQEASVSVTTYFMPQISMRNEVYRYPKGEGCEYVVFDMRDSANHEEYIGEAEELRDIGYEIVYNIEDAIMVLKK